MRSTAIIVGFVAAVTASVLPVPSSVPLELGEIGWEGVVVPGQAAVEVWGTNFEDIQEKIRKEYNPDFSIYSEKIEDFDAHAITENPALVARAQLGTRQVNRNCNSRFGKSQTWWAEEARSNLRRIGGNLCKARPPTCIRMQCVENTAIGACTDNFNNELSVPCNAIADFGTNILNNCFEHVPISCNAQNNCNHSPYGHKTYDQVFSNGGTWNVIIGTCPFFGNGERPVKAQAAMVLSSDITS
ncbi:hypothetical protein F5X68DRAFT_238237 [Plectosphaerella plurivora]|uniref:Uncharacterized protein n=1 Tax=Plectosphaerella plurivora TaxID=936078 RepID=A0A9P9AD01_9PEZI|nr:hypothetical protein F5X68DRAFT_238237 [Plectosphaerella plurivora]